ncbi:MAG: prepilin peptidase [Firmicutes bacterium]|nr:prepilin peptidase [Bacillota bacterium]
MVWVSEVIAGVLLFWLSVCDLKSGRIPMSGLIGFFLCGSARVLLMERSVFLLQCLLSLWVWLSLWLAGKASGNGIGSGDVWLLIAMPFWRTGETLLWTLLLSFLSAAVFGILRYGFRGRKNRFPFVPWITLGFEAVGLAILWKGKAGI